MLTLEKWNLTGVSRIIKAQSTLVRLRRMIAGRMSKCAARSCKARDYGPKMPMRAGPFGGRAGAIGADDGWRRLAPYPAKV